MSRDAMRCHGHELNYSNTTLYYKVLPLLPCSTSTTPVLLCTAKYYSNTTPYYKYYSSTTLYYKVPLKYYKVLLQYYKAAIGKEQILKMYQDCKM